MADHVTVNYISSSLKAYEADLLSLGICDVFLKVSIIRKKDIVKCVYGLNDFTELKNVTALTLKDGLAIAVNTVRNVMQTEKHYIYAEEIELSPRNCYINMKTMDAKFTFFRDNEKLPLREKLANLISYLSELMSETDTATMESIARQINSLDFNTNAIMQYLEKKRHEIS